MRLHHAVLLLFIVAPLAAQAPSNRANPLLTPSTLPFQAPPFDKLVETDYQPAIEEGMKLQQAEIAAIANNPAAPTFGNTIEAMERSGMVLRRTMSVFGSLTSAHTSDAIQAIEREMAPRLAAHDDAIYLNATLFSRIRTLRDTRAKLRLQPEALRLVELYYRDFVRSGALLNDADKDRLKALNQEESSLSTAYSQKRLAANNAAAVVVDDVRELDGMSEADIAAAAKEAQSRNLTGKWVLTLQNTTQQPPLADLTSRALRKRLLDASMARGNASDPNTTEPTIARLAQVRAQQAKLLGFPTWAHYALADQMAKTPDTALKLLTDVVTASTARAREEGARMQKVIDQEGAALTLAASDWEFYAERVRRADYDFDEAEVRPYFELDRVLKDGVFFAANRLYGITLTERRDIPVYHPDVRVWDVREADGRPLGLFYGDFFARPTKAGGAWMNSFVRASRLLETKAVVTNNANFTKPAPGQPVLLTSDGVRTLFHEFGHALHYLFATNIYPRSSSIARDFVEFPSQFNEHWAMDPLVFGNYAKHHLTGAPMPKSLAEKIENAATFNQGYGTTEAQTAALLDLEWHTLPADAPLQNVGAFEAAALKKHNVDLPQVPPRYRSAYFTHIWSNGYSARYYSYLWTDLLDEDAYDWFAQNGGLTRRNGDRFRNLVLAPGGQKDFAQIFRDFRGRDPIATPLLKSRGLDRK